MPKKQLPKENELSGAVNFQQFGESYNKKAVVKPSKNERKKFKVIQKVINGEINGTQAAEKLNLTTRQIRNLKRQVIEANGNIEGIIHRNKYYQPYNTYDEEIAVFICRLYRKSYRGTNFSEFSRVVQEDYGIQASRSTIYNFLRKGHIRSPQRKAKKKKVISYDESGNKIIQEVRVYDRKTTNNPTGKKIVTKTTIKPAKTTKVENEK
jgi:hypothetical protein